MTNPPNISSQLFSHAHAADAASKTNYIASIVLVRTIKYRKSRSSMIPDSRQNRLITKTCISIVGLVAPLSTVFTVYVLLFHQSILGATHPAFALFLWALGETLFWVWTSVYQARLESFERVVPSLEERKKLKDDCLRVIHSSKDGVKDFVE